MLSCVHGSGRTSEGSAGREATGSVLGVSWATVYTPLKEARGERDTARRLVRLEDSGIDGTVNGTAVAIGSLSGRLRRFQNGFVRSYALTMTAGAAVIGLVLVLGRLG